MSEARAITNLIGNGVATVVIARWENEEKTGLPYASKVRTKDDSGRDVPVMHACGHDLHMSSLYGTAAIMSRTKDTWHGTLMLVAQPAEETGPEHWPSN